MRKITRLEWKLMRKIEDYEAEATDYNRPFHSDGDPMFTDEMIANAAKGGV